MIVKFIYLMLLLFIAAMLIIGSSVDQEGIDNLNNISWNEVYTEATYETLDDNSNRLVLIVYKGIDFIGYTALEVAKWGAEYGYENPEYDYGFFFNLIIWAIRLLIILALVPVLIPLIALITMAVMGINNLIKRIKLRRENENKKDRT